MKFTQLCLTLLPHGLYTLWNSPGQNTGVGNLSLLHCIFLTQELNQSLLHCRWILYQLICEGSYEGSHHRDWNARVGSQEIPGITGKFGLGVQNEAGQKLTEFYQENALVIANTFQKHKRRLHMDITRWSIAKSDWLYSLQPNVEKLYAVRKKTRQGVDCGSDHELLIAKFRLKLKKVEKTTRPFRYDLNQIPYSGSDK